MNQVCGFDQLGNGIQGLEFLLPRSYVDVNRAITSLDPSQIRDYLDRLNCLPDYYTSLGHGVVPIRAKVEGFEIYDEGTLPTALEIIERLKFYHAYHEQLQSMILGAVRRHGGYALLDMHSCNPHSAPDATGYAAPRADIIIGDLDGKSCSTGFLEAVRQVYKDHGFTSIALNAPFRGGYITQKYGAHNASAWSTHLPALGRDPFCAQALQIEFNKHLYLADDLRTPIPARVDELREVNRKVYAAANQNVQEHLQKIAASNPN
jgi:N-formylglutamate deformylase